MYTVTDFKTKRGLIDAVASGKEVKIYQPGDFLVNTNHFTGIAYLEGPHNSEPYRWHATVEVKDGLVVSVLEHNGLSGHKVGRVK